MEGVGGVIAFKAGAVSTVSGKDAVDQVMAAHAGAKGVVRAALLIAVLVNGKVKIIVAEEEVVFHGNSFSCRDSWR